MYLTRNQAYVQTYRGFESHPLRHMYSQSEFRAGFKQIGFYPETLEIKGASAPFFVYGASFRRRSERYNPPARIVQKFV